MNPRETLIVELLRLLADGGADQGREGVRGDDGATPIRSHASECRLRHSGLRCSCWVASVDELTRCLRTMRNGGVVGLREGWTVKQLETRRQWHAVHKRYVVSERRPMLVHVKRNRPVAQPGMEVVGLVNKSDLNTKGDGITRVLVELWDESVSLADADAGVRWLAQAFRGPLNLPREMLAAA